MTEVNKHAPGTFSWVELGTTDAAGAKKFYSGLFGWEIDDVPMGEGRVYTMLKLRGKEVAALYVQDEQQRSQGVPAHWLSYVTVASADDSAAQARSHGGKVLMEPFDVMDVGRMAVVQDPTGATLALWEAGRHIGARLVGEPGTLAWSELATNDTEKAGQFYTNLFGWGLQVQQTGPVPYTTFTRGDRPGAGMLPMTEEWGDMPPNWMTYFGVADCNASVEKAKSLGGNIMVPVTKAPGVGHFAVIQDPQGAVFSIIKFDRPTS
jgi:uncharacterized protein